MQTVDSVDGRHHEAAQSQKFWELDSRPTFYKGIQHNFLQMLPIAIQTSFSRISIVL